MTVARQNGLRRIMNLPMEFVKYLYGLAGGPKYHWAIVAVVALLCAGAGIVFVNYVRDEYKKDQPKPVNPNPPPSVVQEESKAPARNVPPAGAEQGSLPEKSATPKAHRQRTPEHKPQVSAESSFPSKPTREPIPEPTIESFELETKLTAELKPNVPAPPSEQSAGMYVGDGAFIIGSANRKESLFLIPTVWYRQLDATHVTIINKHVLGNASGIRGQPIGVLRNFDHLAITTANFYRERFQSVVLFEITVLLNGKNVW